MPLYEYQCDACGRRFERIQKFSDAPVEICPTCGGKVHKMVSSPAFQFKGTGWYVTDYSRKDKGKDQGHDTGEGSKPDAGSSAEKANEAKDANSKESKPASESASTAGESSSAKDSKPAPPSSKT